MKLNLLEPIIQGAVEEQFTINRRTHLDPLGNWCGHDPLTPSFFIANSEHKLRPDVIQWAIIKLNDFYYKPMRWLRSLVSSRESIRQQRSEARERDASVIGVLLHYTELASLRVGVPLNNGNFLNLDMKFIAKRLGWRSNEDDAIDQTRIESGRAPLNKGVKRVWRSIKALKNAGYIEIKEQYQKKEGTKDEYRGLAAVKRILPKLFHELGITQLRLNHRRRQAEKRVKKKQQNYQEQQLTEQGRGLLNSVIDFAKSISAKPKKYIQKPTAQSLEQEKQRQANCFRLKQLPENQDLSPEAFYDKYPELQQHKWQQRE